MIKTNETIFTASYAAGDGYNATMEIKATESGLEIDEAATIPWEWVDRAASLRRLRCVADASDTPSS